jgi:threonine dehydrogenase-like Zn-dependent dehydrogenase
MPVPARTCGSALIRMLRAGICNTDLELQRGYYGFEGVPGHEFSGLVVESDTPSLVDKRVVGEINLACGRCEYCAIELVRHCLNRSVLGIIRHPGAFATYFTLPDANLHPIPDEISDEEAVFIEPLAAACEILDQVTIPAGAEVAILGDGKLGLLIAQTLRAHQADVVIYGRHEAKLEIARRAGARVSLADDPPLAKYPVVIESTGSAFGLRQAVRMTRPRGTVVLKSTVHGEVSLDTAPVVVHEITLVGSRCGRFAPAIELLRQRKVDVSGMIAARFPLSEAPAAFAEAARPGVLKVILCGAGAFACSPAG